MRYALNGLLALFILVGCASQLPPPGEGRTFLPPPQPVALTANPIPSNPGSGDVRLTADFCGGTVSLPEGAVVENVFRGRWVNIAGNVTVECHALVLYQIHGMSRAVYVINDSRWVRESWDLPRDQTSRGFILAFNHHNSRRMSYTYESDGTLQGEFSMGASVFARARMVPI
jgi:hypothetical protein